MLCYYSCSHLSGNDDLFLADCVVFIRKGLVFSATKSGRQINDLFGVAFWLGANMGEKKQRKQFRKKKMLVQLGSASKASFGVKKKVVQTKPASIGSGRYCHLGDPMMIIHCFHLWPEKNDEKSRVGPSGKMKLSKLQGGIFLPWLCIYIYIFWSLTTHLKDMPVKLRIFNQTSGRGEPFEKKSPAGSWVS